MSDDTPTERFDPSGDAPTQRLEQPGDGTELDGTESVASNERRRLSKLMIALIAIGGALLVAIIVLLVLLFSRGGDPVVVPTESATPSERPSPTPTLTEIASPTPTPTPTETDDEPAPPPPAPSPIVSFGVTKTTVDCSSGNPVPITFNWNTTGQSVTFGIGTDNAESAPYQTGLPAVGGITVDYQCGQPDDRQKYAIAVIHNGGVIDRETITVRE